MSSDFFLIVAQLEKYSIGMQRGGSNKNSQDILRLDITDDQTKSAYQKRTLDQILAVHGRAAAASGCFPIVVFFFFFLYNVASPIPLKMSEQFVKRIDIRRGGFSYCGFSSSSSVACARRKSSSSFSSHRLFGFGFSAGCLFLRLFPLEKKKIHHQIQFNQPRPCTNHTRVPLYYMFYIKKNIFDSTKSSIRFFSNIFSSSSSVVGAAAALGCCHGVVCIMFNLMLISIRELAELFLAHLEKFRTTTTTTLYRHIRSNRNC